jgi:hypothetical protein
MTWRAWFGPERPTWLPKVIYGVTALYLVLVLLTRSEVAHLPPHLGEMVRNVMQVLRLGFLAMTLTSAGIGIARQRWGAALGVLTLLVMTVGQFASEVSVLHVPGIWFPWGVGVSRTQYAYMVFDVLLFVLLLVELLRFARRAKPERRRPPSHRIAP